jgi:NADPH:quinone reductase-like Zn-dependent oxidoreductase
MKAVVCSKYGPPEVFKITNMKTPVPGKNEILIKVKAINITISDCIVRSGKVGFLLWLPMRIFVGFSKPRKSILGFELSGEIKEKGKNVKRFQKNDQIIAFTGKRFGAYAEYICLPENGKTIPNDCIILKKPANVSMEEAATILTRGSLALHFLKKIDKLEGKKVLIYGASGGVGTYAIPLAKYFGASVSGVCSTKNIDLVKSLGADRVFDYTNEDFTNDSEKYDLIFDAVGKKYSSKLKFNKVLKSDGQFLSVDDGTPKIHFQELEELVNIIETEKIQIIIDKIYSLEQITEAHEYVEKGHKKGHIVIKVN